MTLVSGTKLGRYEIRSKLGEGGMGEVYLAHDRKLDRKVALKTLPERLLADKSAKTRFIHEAKAASALNNAHIVTVYDIAPEDSRELIVMEYVEGETLRSLLSKRRLDLKRSLEYIEQVANGLAAAHQAGIVHRDIKPENLIVSNNGVAKILDFGLAKLTQRQATALADSHLTTAQHPNAIANVSTAPGTVLGTVGYMSPEQAEGKDLDNRTDIFSLGVVLYEVLTGKRPFEGKSAIDTLHSIINKDPVPVRELNPKVPLELSDLLERTLAKDRKERYQHVGDFELDLRRLRRAIETKPAANAPARNSRLGPIVFWCFIGFAILLSLALAAWIGRSSARSTSAGWSTAHAIATQLTNYGGKESYAALSPDGKSFVFVSTHGGASDIWLRQIAGGEPVKLTNDLAEERDLVYAANGETIFFTRVDKADGVSIWRIGVLGGQARLIVSSAKFPAPSPDGQSLAYFVGAKEGPGDELMVRALDGSNTRILARGVLGGVLSVRPAWSQDSRRLTFVQRGLFAPSNLFAVDVNTGQTRQITKFKRSGEGIEDQVWLPDNRHIIVSYVPQSTFFQSDLGVLDTEDGSISRLTFNIAQAFSSLSISANGSRLIATANQTQREVWKVPLGPDASENGRAATRVLDGSMDPMWTFVSRDGRMLLFNNATTGTRNLWTMPLDRSAAPRQITSVEGDNVMHASLSPDNSHVAFVSRATGNSDIWIQNVDGSDLRQLTADEAADAWPVWSPDGNWIVFGSLRNDRWEIRRVPANGGASEKVMDGFFRGDWIRQPTGNGTFLITWFEPGIRLIDVERRTVVWEERLERYSYTMPMFSSDGRYISLAVHDSDGDAIRLYETLTGKWRIGVKFPGPFPILFRACWVDDGKAVIVNHTETNSHVVLFDNFWKTS